MENVLIAGLVVVQAVVVLAVLLRMQRLEKRYEEFRSSTEVMLGVHQDEVAGHEARLVALGSRGTHIVPTAKEMAEGRWQR